MNIIFKAVNKFNICHVIKRIRNASETALFNFVVKRGNDAVVLSTGEYSNTVLVRN